jgi:hypothetical protein
MGLQRLKCPFSLVGVMRRPVREISSFWDGMTSIIFNLSAGGYEYVRTSDRISRLAVMSTPPLLSSPLCSVAFYVFSVPHMFSKLHL